MPVHVVWEITLACNLRCAHCGSRAGAPRPSELSTEEAKRLIGELASLGTREITLIGGEAYLRRDWLELVRTITQHGIHCGLQTGGRAFSEAKLQAGVDAGLRSIGVSIDGDRALHDMLRGVRGSYDQAITLISGVARAGIAPGVNTQINNLSLPLLGTIFEEILAAGAKFWQVQLTVAMGNAVDRSDLLLQPFQILEAIDKLAELFEEGREHGLRLLPGNSIGYFGPHEHRWRTLDDQIKHWEGCTAGETTLGLEADGKIKSCPSLPATTFQGGLYGLSTIAEAVESLDGRRAARLRPRRGFCGSCYYWNVCKSGCTWVGHMLTGTRGENPYCYYRARQLRERGIIETLTKIREAPGKPFDRGHFRVEAHRVEGGEAVSRRQVRDFNRRPSRGRKLVICSNCHEFVFATEVKCLHCGASRLDTIDSAPHDGAQVLRLVREIAAHDAEIADRLSSIASRRSSATDASARPSSRHAAKPREVTLANKAATVGRPS